MSCYNAERWLHESIDTVLNQSFRDFELLLIDDGSTDRTPEIIEKYRAIDERIVAVRKPNTGLADSLNKGIEIARGTWIARLDADDLCEPTRLEEQVDFLNRNPAVVLLGTGFVEINERGEPYRTHAYPAEHERLVYSLERSRAFFPHSSAMYRTDLAREIGGYNARIHRAEDVRLWLEFATRGKIAALPQLLLKIRKHPNQISNDSKGVRQYYDGRSARVCHFLQKMSCPDPARSGTDEEWATFLSWVEQKINASPEFERRAIIQEARRRFRENGSKAGNLARAIVYLLRSGQLISIGYERWFGTSLAERLAVEWKALQLQK
jgi:glycosyltransferase involved in cell wall biosynthesis